MSGQQRLVFDENHLGLLFRAGVISANYSEEELLKLAPAEREAILVKANLFLLDRLEMEGELRILSECRSYPPGTILTSDHCV